VKAEYSDQEYRQYVSRLSLLDVESALASVDGDKFPSRLQILLDRKSEIMGIENSILEEFDAKYMFSLVSNGLSIPALAFEEPAEAGPFAMVPWIHKSTVRFTLID
jgi:hypothetical protein